ncbi:MAG: hypothetical protein A3J76_04855 [Candidatus Moranbacteria bacterium RBG_13_45_13]|nr:MAG: hypothetical protein A3J76_04855 [Candidatus Moranbacteria bacterium RBG_13_45_13]
MLKNEYDKTTVATFPIAGYQAKDLAWTIGFIAAAVLFPTILAHTPQNQWITGTIVNAIIFLAVWRVGIVNATFVAALPSSVALVRGLLPAPMAIMVPYIIVSNLVLILIFYSFKKHRLTGVIAASAAKFALLFVITTLFIPISHPLIGMLQWPQLATALAGGLVVIGIIKLSAKT